MKRKKKEDEMPVYSEDLRVKVVEFVKKGHTHREAAEVFGVCMKSICTWKKLDKEGKDWCLSLFRGVRIE